MTVHNNKIHIVSVQKEKKTNLKTSKILIVFIKNRGGYDILKNHTIVLPDYTIYNLLTNKCDDRFDLRVSKDFFEHRFEKSQDLPTPRCRSLIIVTNDSIFCVSGLTETRDVDTARKLKICRVSVNFIDKISWRNS